LDGAIELAPSAIKNEDLITALQSQNVARVPRLFSAQRQRVFVGRES
jgi:hypothetical protein